jgi:hypothetical protein
MSAFERIDINKRRTIPNWIKLVLLVTVIFGITLRNCWKKSQTSDISITDIEISDYTIASIDVNFVITNPNDVELTKKIIIKAYLASGEELASRLTSIKVSPKSKKRYLKILTKLQKPLNDINEISLVTVEVYNP